MIHVSCSFYKNPYCVSSFCQDDILLHCILIFGGVVIHGTVAFVLAENVVALWPSS